MASWSSNSATPASNRSLAALASVFHGLADEQRLRILFSLAQSGELTVKQISAILNQAQPAVSHHLTVLKDAGIITFRRDGKFNYYRLIPGGLSAPFHETFGSQGPIRTLIHDSELPAARSA
jgi:ArsR family transcriptional regulator